MKQKNSLLNGLKEFGLNPHRWFLKRVGPKHIWLIVHKQDPHFCLKGRSNNRDQWQDLQWQVE